MQRLFPSQGSVHDTHLSSRSSEDAICAKSRISSQGSLAIYCSMLSIRQISNVFKVEFPQQARGKTLRKRKKNGKDGKLITLNTDYKPHSHEVPFILPKVCVKIMNTSIAITLITIFH